MTNTNIPVKKKNSFIEIKKATSCVTSVYTSQMQHQIILTDHLLQALQTPWTSSEHTERKSTAEQQ